LDGRKVTLPLVRQFVQEELQRIRGERGQDRFEHGHFPQATRLFDELVANENLEEFLTLKAYELLS
jgi:malate synthase